MRHVLGASAPARCRLAAAPGGGFRPICGGSAACGARPKPQLGSDFARHPRPLRLHLRSLAPPHPLQFRIRPRHSSNPRDHTRLQCMAPLRFALVRDWYERTSYFDECKFIRPTRKRRRRGGTATVKAMGRRMARSARGPRQRACESRGRFRRPANRPRWPASHRHEPPPSGCGREAGAENRTCGPPPPLPAENRLAEAEGMREAT